MTDEWDDIRQEVEDSLSDFHDGLYVSFDAPVEEAYVNSDVRPRPAAPVWVKMNGLVASLTDEDLQRGLNYQKTVVFAIADDGVHDFEKAQRIKESSDGFSMRIFQTATISPTGVDIIHRVYAEKL